MISTMFSITDFVKEKGITNIILSYKKHMEWGDILKKHNNNFREICEKEDLTEDFIDYFEDKIIWPLLSERKLSYNILEKYQEKINWGLYIAENNPSEELLSEFHCNFKGGFEEDSDRDDWFMISAKYILSEDFLHRYREKIHWNVYLDNDNSESLREEYYDIIRHQQIIIMNRWDEYDNLEDEEDEIMDYI